MDVNNLSFLSFTIFLLGLFSHYIPKLCPFHTCRDAELAHDLVTYKLASTSPQATANLIVSMEYVLCNYKPACARKRHRTFACQRHRCFSTVLAQATTLPPSLSAAHAARPRKALTGFRSNPGGPSCKKAP